MTKFLRVGLVLTIFAFMGQYHVSPSDAKKMKTSGFLEDYSGFEESEEIKGLEVKKNPDRSIADYQKFMLEPITVFLKPRGKLSKVNPRRIGVNPKKLAKLTEHFENELIEKLSENYTVVTEPGEGVLLLRIAITDVEANMPLMNVHMYSSVTGVGLGKASMEGEAVDSVTGEQILAVIDSRKGKFLPKMKDQGAVDMGKEALDNKIDSLSKYKTVKQIMTNWADNFVKKVDEMHALKEMSGTAAQ